MLLIAQVRVSGIKTKNSYCRSETRLDTRINTCYNIKKGGVYLKVNELKKILRENDCYFYREGSRHEIWISTRTGRKFQVPRHGTQDVPIGTLKAIKQSAGIE